MSNDKRHFIVQPGPCPVIDGVPVCPPPIEIDVIKVKKVFEECQHTQVEEVQIEFEVDTIDNDLEAKCVKVEVLEEECRVINGGLVKVTATLAVTSKLNGQKETVEFSIDKNFRLRRAGEKDLKPQCHIFPTCLFCFVSDEDIEEEETIVTVTCCVGILIVIKLEAEVQLIIPTYGYPPLPPRCDRVLGECPDDFEPVWPPYPVQDRGNNNGGTGGCPSCG
ncbi:MAG: hypothetical protein KGZ96_13325 [Clostridia bacterium]|jgi:hypothetical protein|nr:hypothetical protein [Clostridia bacterium]